MDVRCDRCQTEYELDDASVAAGSATVQCTTCGHTFVVSRSAPAFVAGGTPAPATAPSSQPSASWMLTTEEGKTHRFRDSTTLQKWIVERRVTRSDTACAPGGTWRRLGDVEELKPFFDVVDQADRAAAAGRVRPTRPETPRSTAPPRNAYVSPDPDDDDVLTTGRGRREQLSASMPALLDDDDLAAAGLHSPRRGRAVVVGGLLLLLIGGAGYLGFKHGAGSSTPVASAPAPEAPAAPVARAAPLAPAPAPAPAAPSPAPPVAPGQPAPAASPSPAPPAKPAVAEAAPAPARPASTSGESSHAHSYERLVADADRALENGQTAKAQKMYDEALHMQPNGVAAMTGSAYVLLDKHKPLAAIDTFRRALSISPGFSQALFGMGEAYRLEGEPAQAIAAYKRYLDASPNGADAPAARRQIRDLESQTGAPHAAATAPTEPP